MGSEEYPKQGSKSANEASRGDDASPGRRSNSFDAQRQRWFLGKMTSNLPRGYAAEVFFPIPIDFVAPFGIL